MTFPRFLRNLLALTIVCVYVIGCKKDEGPGGTSTIKGKIIVHDYDAGFQSPNGPLAIYPAIEQETYIIYGTDHTSYDDHYKTSYDGSYEFKYLQKGHYRLYAYSKDSTGAKMGFPSLAKIPVFVDVEITSKGTTVNVPDLIILNNKQ